MGRDILITRGNIRKRVIDIPLSKGICIVVQPSEVRCFSIALRDTGGCDAAKPLVGERSDVFVACHPREELAFKEFRQHWFDDRQTGVDDAKRELEVHPDGKLREIVGEVSRVKIYEGDDAKDGDDTYPVGRTRVSVDYRASEGRGTYTAPSPKIIVSATFLDTGICRPHSMGMGKTTTKISIRRLKTLIGIKTLGISPQVPGMVLSQNLEKGRQVKHAWRTTTVQKHTVTAMVAYTTVRNLR